MWDVIYQGTWGIWQACFFWRFCCRTHGSIHNKTMIRNDAERVARGRLWWYLLGPDSSSNGKPVLLWTFPHSLQGLCGFLSTCFLVIQDLTLCGIQFLLTCWWKTWARFKSEDLELLAVWDVLSTQRERNQGACSEVRVQGDAEAKGWHVGIQQRKHLQGNFGKSFRIGTGDTWSKLREFRALPGIWRNPLRHRNVDSWSSGLDHGERGCC